MKASVDTIERDLAAKRAKATGEHAGVRTHVVDLVAFTSSRAAADEAFRAVAGAERNRPSRALIATTVEGARSVAAESCVFASTPAHRDGALMLTEIVRLTGPPESDVLATMVASLLVPDLPVFLLWLAPPRFDRPPFAALRGLATRLVTDSVRHPRTLEALPGMVRAEQPVVTDLAWTKITGWREVIAGLFDVPEHAAMLPRLRRVGVQYVKGSDAQARLVAGWLAHATDTHPEVVLEPVERRGMRSGSLVGVELRCGRRTFSVERVGEGVARTHSPRLPDSRLALRVPPFAELVGDELEHLTYDEAFANALESATDVWS